LKEPTEWMEKISANNIFDKGLASRIYKKLYHSTTKKLNFLNAQRT
jgi:hypothetical protein